MVISLPAFTRLSAFLFMPPPTPSQGPFPWPASNQVHKALRPNSDGNFATRAHIVRFRYCDVGESGMKCRVDSSGRSSFTSFISALMKAKVVDTLSGDTCNPHVALRTKLAVLLEVYHHWVYGHLELVIVHCLYFFIVSAHPSFSIVL